MTDIQKLKNYDGHRAVFLFTDSSVGLKAYVAIHRGGLVNPAFGATRLWWYESDQEALEDALKLSRMMSYKSALAGLNYGGAKAFIVKPSRVAEIEPILLAYSQQLNFLSKHFVTGADVGIGAKELALMTTHNDSIVGLRSDPVQYTALGVSMALETTLTFLFGSKSAAGRSFAIQGVGKTGEALLGHVYANADRIFVSDIDSTRLKDVQSRFPKVTLVGPQEIHQMPVDVFCPCALSNSIDITSIKQLQCKAIVGSANGQLENTSLGEQLHKRGILYAPDYLINSGGLITVVDEYSHSEFAEKRILDKLNVMRELLLRIYAESREKDLPTNTIADSLAQERIASFQ